MSVKWKLTGIIFILIAILVLGLKLYTNNVVSDIVETNTKEEFFTMSATILKQIESQLDNTELAVVSIAENKSVSKAFAERDREELLNLLMDGYEKVSDRVAQFQFHLPDSTSFLRLHKPEKFGDDLSSFRFTVNEANSKKTIVKGIESGVAGYGLRVVVPVSYLGEHVGTVEYGGKFDEVLLSEFKSQFPGEYFLYSFSTSSEGPLSGTLEEDNFDFDKSIEEQLKNGESIQVVSNDGNSYIGYIPFVDYKGEQVGYIKYIQDRTEYINEMKKLNYGILMFSIMALLIASLLVYIIVHTIVIKLKRLEEYSVRVGQGDLSTECTLKSADEIGSIAKSFNIMKNELNNLITEIHSTAEEVANNSDKVLDIVSTIAVASNEITLAVDEIAEGASDQVEDANAGSRKMNELSNSINKIVDISVSSMKQAEIMIEKTSAGIKKIEDLKNSFTKNDDSVKKVAIGIQELGEKSNTINDIVETINNIADQTNLLALNAAIEAARAGEHGKGFAVVADEVRKLAEQSSQATEEIRIIINDISNVIHNTEESMEVSNTIINETNISLSDTVNSYRDIEKEASKVIDNIKITTEHARQIDEESILVIDSINGILEVSSQSAAATEEISATVNTQNESISSVDQQLNSMNKTILDLKNKLKKFKI